MLSREALIAEPFGNHAAEPAVHGPARAAGVRGADLGFGVCRCGPPHQLEHPRHVLNYLSRVASSSQRTS